MIQKHTPKTYSVSELTSEISHVLEQGFQDVWVEGEISNFVHHRSGHMYFSLKDADSQLRCVMFKYANRNLRFQLENGAHVRAFGSLSVYRPQGSYQLIITRMDPSGIGALHQAFERLKRKLMEEGLFDEKWKKPIPKFPGKIGIVTSPSGAAISDIANVISRRYPLVDLFLCPARVQGQTASSEIVRAIRTFQSLPAGEKPDVLIVGRGGGSIEDLWPFNEENVARAVFACEIPVISAVGHEIDFTICDFVADLRAPTPSAAAEYAVPDIVELRHHLDVLGGRLRRSIARILELKRLYTHEKSRHKIFKPFDYIREMQLNLDRSQDNLSAAVKNKVYVNGSRLSRMHAQFLCYRPDRQLLEYKSNLTVIQNRLVTAWRKYTRDKTLSLHQHACSLKRFNLDKFYNMIDKMTSTLKGHNPKLILEKGYAICSLSDNTIISSIQSVQTGNHINVELRDGGLACEILGVRKEMDECE
jgi:exodeoxyribonuclease VII large subunit